MADYQVPGTAGRTMYQPRQNPQLNFQNQVSRNIPQGGTLNQNLENQATQTGSAAASGVRASLPGMMGADYGDNTFLKQLALSAAGQGPSAAERLGSTQILENQRAMQGMAQSARGGNMAGSMRAAMSAGSDLGLRGMQQLSALRAQEQLAAQQVGAQQTNAYLQGQEQARQGRIQAATQAGQAFGGLGQDIRNQNAQMRLANKQENRRFAMALTQGIADTGARGIGAIFGGGG